MRPILKLFKRNSPGRHRNDGITQATAVPRESEQAMLASQARLDRDTREVIVPLRRVLDENHITDRFRREIRSAIIERTEGERPGSAS